MASDGSDTIAVASSFGQQLSILFVSLLAGAMVLAFAMVHLGRLRDPMRETHQSERRDARALRKEHAMPVWVQLAYLRAGLEATLVKYFKRYHTTPRHARTEGQPLSTALLVGVYRRQQAESAKKSIRTSRFLEEI